MQYALKKIRKITLKDIETGENKAILSEIKSAALTGNSDVVWADGANGSHLVGFDVNKVAGLTAENGIIDSGYLEVQTGGKLEKVSNGNSVLFTETLTVRVNDIAVTTHKASGLIGNEIAFVYAIDSTGSPDRTVVYKQGAIASATTFEYNPSTNEITLPTGKFNEGDKVYVEYFPKFDKYEELSNEADSFSETCAVYVDAWFTDVCSRKDIPLQIVLPAGKVSGEINYTLGDNPSVQSLKVDALTTCGDTTLWKLYKYSLEDVSNI